jgi:hypothetical protein
MEQKTRLSAFIGILLLGIIVAGILLAGKPTTAQDSAAGMRALLERLNRENTGMMMQFDKPFAGGETLWRVPDQAARREIAEIGDDYICFSEPWNNGQRIHCTPYSNIVNVSYER